MITDDVFTLSSNQTYREKEGTEAADRSTHWHSSHLSTGPSWIQGTKTTWQGWELHLSWEGLLSCHRALLEGSSATGSSKYLQISYWSYTGSHSLVSPAQVPVMRPGRAGELKPSSREWCHLDCALILVTCSPSWCCCSPSSEVQVIREPEGKGGSRKIEKEKNACTFPLFH